MVWKFLRLLLVTLLLGAASCTSDEAGAPLSPQEALDTFRLHPDFEIQIFAAEPHVTDPVEIVFDEEGRVYAAEMRDYPDDPPPGKPARGRIRLMEDSDGDGRIDRSTIFAEELLQVTSVLPWKGGVLVASAPDILFFKDTDGDGKADVREVLFTGFAEKVNSEGRITNLRFNVDNWIYASNNGQAGEITSPAKPEAPPVSVLGADFRFRPDQGSFEPASGPTQFGQGIDAFGNRFITQNTVHVRQVVLPRRYLARNPYLPAGAAAQDISDHGRPSAPVFQISEPQEWRKIRSRMRQERYRENRLDQVRELNPSTEIASGYATGSAGGTVFLGDAFPPGFQGNLFTGDVAGNLVHRDLLQRDGVLFRASRATEDKDREFLASTDPWFRPCNLANGPDGNLYVVDMYRQFIETPESIPEELKKTMDFYSGDDRGRIYRIIPRRRSENVPERPRLRSAATAELAALLEHPNGWWRFTAHRLLVERQDDSAIPFLQSLLAAPAPETRLHALYALEALSDLEARTIRNFLNDPHPELRRHAVQLAEDHPELLPDLLALEKDGEAAVQLQLALSLGEFEDPRVVPVLARLLTAHSEDSWFQSAVLSSPQAASVQMAQALVQTGFYEQAEAGRKQVVHSIGTVVGARGNLKEVEQWLMLLASRRPQRETWQAAGLNGLAAGMELAGHRGVRLPRAQAQLSALLSSSSEELREAARLAARHFEIPQLVQSARRDALDASLSESQRIRAAETLAGAPFKEAGPVLEKLLEPGVPVPIFRAAAQSTASFQSDEAARLLLSQWKQQGPEARAELLHALLRHSSLIPAVLTALEQGRVEVSSLDLAQREKLLRNPDPAVQSRASALLKEFQPPASRPESDYRDVLTLGGDAGRGRKVFEDTCARCHLSREGIRIGPDLSGVSSHTKEQLLHSILEPSADIRPGYSNYILTTRDGQVLDGLIVRETPGTLTIRTNQGEDLSILRSNLQEVRSSSVSLMPSGLEEGLSRQDLADLIAFLQGANLRSGE